MQHELERALAEYGLPLDGDKLARMCRYWEYLKRVNEQMNLTRVTTDEDAAQRHFVDSLAAVKLNLLPQAARVLDLGSGAGFPGLPLKIARPDIDMTLMDSLGKRVDFLREAASVAGVAVTALHARAEEAARGELREAFDVVTARAVARLNVLCELSLPFVRKGGLFIAYKGAAAAEELREAARAITLLGGGDAHITSAGIQGREACLITVRKLRGTPSTYPRRPGEAGRNPIV